MKTVFLLLFGSNPFMTMAWYGQLQFKWFEGKSLHSIILASWGIAFFEYGPMVPANRAGYFAGGLTGYQLKIIQGCVTLGGLSVARAQGAPHAELRRKLHPHHARPVVRHRLQERQHPAT